MKGIEAWLDSSQLTVREKERYLIARLEEAKIRARSWMRRYRKLEQVHTVTAENLRRSRAVIDAYVIPECGSDFSDAISLLYQ